MTDYAYRKAKMTGLFFLLNSDKDYEKHVETGQVWTEFGNDGWELVSTEMDNGNVWGFFKKARDEFGAV